MAQPVTHSKLYFRSGDTLNVVETVAQIWAAAPQNVVWPTSAGVMLGGTFLTPGSGPPVWVALAAVERIEVVP
jgi:hypothetical protein